MAFVFIRFFFTGQHLSLFGIESKSLVVTEYVKIPDEPFRACSNGSTPLASDGFILQIHVAPPITIVVHFFLSKGTFYKINIVTSYRLRGRWRSFASVLYGYATTFCRNQLP